MQTTIDSGLARQIQRQCGENVFLCYQCQKCSSGCPVAEHFDLAPNQLIRAIQLGRKDDGASIPDLVALRHVRNLRRQMSSRYQHHEDHGCLEDHGPQGGARLPRFLPPFFSIRRRCGGSGSSERCMRAGLMGEITLRQMVRGSLDYKQLLRRDLPLALRMVKKGKLRIFPSFGKVTVPKKSGPEKRSDRLLPRLQSPRNLQRVRPLHAGRAFNAGGRP